MFYSTQIKTENNFEVDGYLFGVEDSEFSDHIINGIKENGVQFIKTLNGRYRGWIRDEGKLYIFTDRYASMPIYIYNTEELVISSDFNKLVRYIDNPTLDKYAISEFLMYSAPFSDHTFVTEIRRVKNGTLLIVNLESHEIKKHQYFHYIVQNKSETNELEEMEEKLYTLLNNTVEKSLVGIENPLCGNSGGMDSRAILSLLNRLNIDFQPYTYYIKKNSDAHTIAHQIANEINKENVDCVVNIDRGFELIEEWINSNPMNSALPAFSYSAVKSLEDNFNSVINGFFADNIVGKHLKDIPEVTTDREVKRLYDSKFIRLYPSDLEDITRYNINDHDQVIEERLIQELKKSKNTTASGKFDELDVTHRQMRVVVNSPVMFFNDHLTSRSPFLENEVVDFFLSIPIEYRRNAFLYYRTFANRMGNLSLIRLERSPFTPKNKIERPKLRKLMWKLDRGFVRVFGISPLYNAKPSHKKPKYLLTDPKFQSKVKQLLSEKNDLFDQLINQERLCRDIEQYFQGSYTRLFNILSLFIWCRTVNDEFGES